MTEQEAKEKPIHEVWEVADYLIRLSIPHLEKLASPDYIVNEDRRPIYKVQLESSRKSLEMLRRVLLERCACVPDALGYYSTFEIERGQILCQLYTFEGNMSRAWRKDNAETARNMSAAYAFMAWELRQRQKEQEGGGK